MDKLSKLNTAFFNTKLWKDVIGPILIIVIPTLTIVFAFFVPVNSYKEVLDAKAISGNYIFAADLEYQGERIGASSELCSHIFFNPDEKEFPVIVEETLFITRRYPDKTLSTKK